MRSKHIVFLIICFSTLLTFAAQPNIDKPNKRPSAIQAWLNDQKPLSTQALISLVRGNSIIGHTMHSHSLYELYFERNGIIIFRKANDNQQLYIGKWWTKDNTIFSTWPTYKKNQINQLKYYHIVDEIYNAYNVNDACGKANTFCDAFMVVKGDPFHLKQYVRLKKH